MNETQSTTNVLMTAATATTAAAATQTLLAVEPRVNITVRAGTLADVGFMDAMQKQTTQQVGWMPTKQLEGKVKAGHVLVAEVNEPRALAAGASESVAHASGSLVTGTRVGYLIGCDQYFKRDDVGIIYQMNVLPAYRRSLVAASLLKAQFERSAWGCKLYCCWCAQDIEANRFWESMGFVALAFRTGSEKKARTHIFWQKRIRQDDEVTPWWFPSQTTGGAIREDRLVLPIPPGVNWRDEMPVLLPTAPRLLTDEPAKRRPAVRKAKAIAPVRLEQPRNGVVFAVPMPVDVTAVTTTELAKVAERPTPTPRVKVKNDPQLVAAARELRDRWLDEVNAGRYQPAMNGKYAVNRAIDGGGTVRPLLVA
ncbi:MAG TPA: GNAT family N-acetyltransferase [Tepidisphaeraceae bacterium]|jgi:hypothetical protein|nr:GNAT family N-acetyltransferase [Tepidisphaeraceae bacterium]